MDEVWEQGAILETLIETHLGTCLIHSAGLKNSIIHPIHYSSALHYQSAQRNKINPARNNSLWRDFFSTKHLAGLVEVCTQTQSSRVYEHIISLQSAEHNNPLQENVAVVKRDGGNGKMRAVKKERK